MSSEHKSHRRVGDLVYDFVKFAFIALLIITPFRFFIAQPFIVSGASMAPTLEPGEYLVVDEVTYDFHEPQRGDVIIFRYPLDPEIYFVKRIVGLPGEVVDIRDGSIVIHSPGAKSERTLFEPYRVLGKKGSEDQSIQLDENEYFVLGDNRDESSDSRTWGPVQKRFIIGRAAARLYPLSRIELFPGDYNFPAAPADK